MIDINNYEQYALKYLDGELPSEIHHDFERFLKNHPEIQEQLDELYEMRTLPLLSFHYPNKEKLYKKEKSVGAFWAWSIAASLLFIIGVGLLYIFQNNSGAQIEGFDKSPISENRIVHGERKKQNEKLNPRIQEKSPLISPEQKKPEQVVKKEVKKSNDYFLEDDAPNQEDPVVEFLDEKIIPIKENDLDKILMDPFDTDVGRKIEMVTLVEPIPLLQFRLDHTAVYPEMMRDKSYVKNQNAKPRTILIELPDEFFSESWRDLSLANLKEKLIPDFLKTKSK